MRGRRYTLFIGLMFSSFFALFLIARKEAEQSSRKLILDEVTININHYWLLIKKNHKMFKWIQEEIEYCEWKMMHDPAMQQHSSNHERWNVSLLLSLGLLAPKTSYGFNDSSMIYRQSMVFDQIKFHIFSLLRTLRLLRRQTDLPWIRGQKDISSQ